jgi:tRNA 2-selenouridine synthase
LVEDITVEQFVAEVMNGDVTPIDVRSPGEFAEGTVPGSYNIPLFDNQERHEIGTIYKQQSIEAAKARGVEIVAAKLPAMIRELQSIPGRKAIFCWRGGMRSKTAATLLSILAGKVYRVQGGFRAYRQWVVQTIETFEWKPRLIVINGYTGTGKTKILRSLQAQGYPVIDLESIAAHRGSIFGGIGLAAHNQRTFDALLIQSCLRLQTHPYVLMEAESRRVGKVVIPEFLYAAKAKAQQLIIHLPMEQRVSNILADYEPHLYSEAVMSAFERIERKIHTPAATAIRTYLQQEDYAAATRLLLEYYYDPRYAHVIAEYDVQRTNIVAQSAEDAQMQIMSFLDSQM